MPDASFASFFLVGPNNYWGQGDVGQISAPVPLLAGVPYFMRVLHVQGSGADWFDAAVRISTADPIGSEAQRRLRSTPTVLLVQTTSAVVREVQVRPE